MRIKALVAAVGGCLVLAGCGVTSGATVTPSLSVVPFVVLHAPESVAEGEGLTVVVDSAGHDGEPVQLYAFLVDFNEVSGCVDTSVAPKQVVLAGGVQSVSVSTAKPGDVWWMLTGAGVSVGCGDLTTRILADPFVGTDPNRRLQGDIWPVGKDQSYAVTARPVGGVTITGTVTWVGPFRTAPEANVTPCPTTPVAFVDHFSIDASMGDLSKSTMPSQDFVRTISEPGVYRVMLAVDATTTTVAEIETCENSELVTVG